jgi:hypothetical protein
MIRKDIALEADRPHYYSQFWVDVAAGKREIGGARIAAPEPDHELIDYLDNAPDDAASGAEVENEVAAARPARPAKLKSDTKKAEPARSALTSLADLANIDLMMRNSAKMADDTVPDIESAAAGGASTDEAIVTDFDPEALVEEEPVAEEETEYAGEDFDEEDEWGEGDEPRRGSKPSKRQRREPRRDF